VGLDQIMADFIRNLSGTQLTWLTKAYTRILQQKESVPNSLKEAYLALIPKTTDEEELLNVNNFRPIAVLPVLYRLLIAIINQ
jgi:hypothetical protein